MERMNRSAARLAFPVRPRPLALVDGLVLTSSLADFHRRERHPAHQEARRGRLEVGPDRPWHVSLCVQASLSSSCCGMKTTGAHVRRARRHPPDHDRHAGRPRRRRVDRRPTLCHVRPTSSTSLSHEAAAVEDAERALTSSTFSTSKLAARRPSGLTTRPASSPSSSTRLPRTFAHGRAARAASSSAPTTPPASFLSSRPPHSDISRFFGFLAPSIA